MSPNDFRKLIVLALESLWHYITHNYITGVVMMIFISIRVMFVITLYIACCLKMMSPCAMKYVQN